ncbi:unnamed protein product [Spirodela intermedia]|uniref:Uncharacterized protein n=1 Tax=Spirodela intermedia TaxID=51605 RepID=A0A7I8KFL9_SPIIN|nr:unnamed protein product [Spirodela intermedia]CAB1184556.1 unnamed protein product [Spirodela intermedia]
MSSFSHLWTKRGRDSVEGFSLLDHVKTSFFLSPKTMRRFWRVSVLKPEDVLDIIVGFGPKVAAREVDFLLKLFSWASKQEGDFTHLPRTFELMISTLLRAQRLTDAESFLYDMQASGVYSPGLSDFFSEIIKGYIENWDWKRSIALYDQARCLPSVLLNVSCYRALLHWLVQMQKTELAERIYADMGDVGLVSSNENYALDFVVQTLCTHDKVLEALNLLKRVRNLGIHCGCKSLDSIADAYSRKSDFEDLLKFLKEWKHMPRASVCHQILFSMSKTCGTDKAWSFMQSLEVLGFESDAKTFGIFIRWSCREGNLRNASRYMSELYTRMLKPDVHACNALLGALSKEGMWECLKEVCADMMEKGIKTEMSTFRVVLAGLCMMRRFVEVKLVLGEMVDIGLVSLSPLEDTVSMAFSVLGLGDLQVKVKRDNGLHSSKAEFFDFLGNGLFLDTDIRMLERRLNRILDDAMAPNFDLLVQEECRKGGAEAAIKMVEEAAQIGESLSFSTYSKLLETLVTSRPCKVKEAVHVLEEIPELCKYLDDHTVNLLLLAFYKKGVSDKARMMLDVLLHRRLPIEAEPFMAFVTAFYKEKDVHRFHELWDGLQGCNWLPEFKNVNLILHFLLEHEMFEEAFELFEIMSLTRPQLIPAICSTFVKELCDVGFTTMGHALVDEVFKVTPHVLEQSCYECLIAGLYREKKFMEAFHVIDLMIETTVSLSPGMWEIIAYMLLGSSRIEKASRPLKKLIFSKELEGYSPLSRALLDELCRVGGNKNNSRQLQKLCMGDLLLPVESILNIIIQHRCQEKNLRGAYELLCIVLKMNVPLDISAYRDLVCLSCSVGLVHVGLNLKEHMLREHAYAPQTIYNILMFHFLKKGNSSVVDLVLDEMRQRHYIPDQFSYNFLVHGYHRCGDGQKSVDSLNTMISKGMQPTNRSLRISVDYLCRHQRHNEALRLCQKMENKCWKYGAVTQTILIKSLLQRFKIDEAELLLSRLQDKDLIPTKANYDILVECFCRLGRVNTSVNLLNLMLIKGGSFPSEKSYNLVLKGLVSSCAFDEALDIHAEMLNIKVQPDMESYEMLIRGLCGHGKTSDAEQLLDVMVGSSHVPSSGMFQLVLDRYRLEKNIHKTSEILGKMQQCGLLPEFETHWSLISSLSSTNDKRGENDDGKGFLSNLLSQAGFDERGSRTERCLNTVLNSAF